MNNRVSSIKNIRTITALRGEILKIDLGKEYAGGILTAWMKKNPNDITYREFTIESNRYITLSKDKTKDYYNISNELVEAIAGKWYFDVEFLADGDDESLSKTIYTGTIFFVNDVTGSPGYEITGDGIMFPEYALLPLDGDNLTLTKNGNEESVVNLSKYTSKTKTSDLTNDGADGTSTYVEHDELGPAATSNDYNDLDNLPSIPLEYQIKGTRLEANVSTTYNIDLNVASDFHLTLTANTTFTFTNLPSGTNVVRCKLRLTGEFTPIFSQGWLYADGDDYDGTKWNDVIVEISNGNATFEKGELLFSQRENS